MHASQQTGHALLFDYIFKSEFEIWVPVN